MKKTIWIAAVGILLGVGCARVRVEAPKEPIKVDISMRLDVYQHVTKDINDIENIVSGGAQQPKSSDKSGMLGYFLVNAYAQDSGLSPEIESAALRRKDRKDKLDSWEAKGVAGENRSGLIEVRKQDQLDSSLRDLIKSENDDRMIIYKALAEKNGVPLSEIQKVYAKKLIDSAPSGTPVETATGWEVK